MLLRRAWPLALLLACSGPSPSDGGSDARGGELVYDDGLIRLPGAPQCACDGTLPGSDERCIAASCGDVQLDEACGGQPLGCCACRSALPTADGRCVVPGLELVVADACCDCSAVADPEVCADLDDNSLAAFCCDCARAVASEGGCIDEVTRHALAPYCCDCSDAVASEGACIDEATGYSLAPFCCEG